MADDIPDFDLRAPTAGPPTTQRVVSMGEETIQIVPHPTTNRYPWSPVENPKVAVYQTVEVPIDQPAAPPPPAPIAVPPQPSPPPRVSMPLPPAVPVAVVTAPMEVVMPMPTSLPIPKPIMGPITEPITEPIPAPVGQPVFTVEEPIPEPVLPTVSAVPAPLESGQHGDRPIDIYSDSTREAWRVFKPSRLIRILLMLLIVTLVAGATGFWLFSGAPSNIIDIPLLQPILHAQ